MTKTLDVPKLRFTFEPKRQRVMRSRGVDGQLFAGKRNAFEFDVAAVRIKPDIPNLVVRNVSVRKQVNSLIKIFSNPLRGRPIIGIAGYPSDLRAKMLALNIVNCAIAAQDAASRGQMAIRDYPFWHKVYGGLGDPIRDKELSDNPSMLVLSNIDYDSTAHKIEKVRDILEQNTHIPRIVVLGGSDPVTFFARKLHLPMDYGFYLSANNREGNSSNILNI